MAAKRACVYGRTLRGEDKETGLGFVILDDQRPRESLRMCASWLYLT
jgi:hypothetical protein